MDFTNTSSESSVSAPQSSPAIATHTEFTFIDENKKNRLQYSHAENGVIDGELVSKPRQHFIHGFLFYKFSTSRSPLQPVCRSLPLSSHVKDVLLFKQWMVLEIFF